MGTTNAPVRWSLRNEFTILKNIDFSFNLYSYMGHKSLEGYYLNNDNGGSLMTYASILSRRIIGRLKTRSNTYARLEAQGPDGATGAQRLHNRNFISSG